MKNINSNATPRYRLLERCDPNGMDTLKEYSTFEEARRDVMMRMHFSLVHDSHEHFMSVNNGYLHDIEDENIGFSVSLLYTGDTKVTEKGVYQIKPFPRTEVMPIEFQAEFSALKDCVKEVDRLITVLMTQGQQACFEIVKDETDICGVCTFEAYNDPSAIPRLQL